MKRIEIIANKSIEEDIVEAVEATVTESRYTKVLDVHGRGSNGSRFGDNIWPELNFILLVFCNDAEAEKLSRGLVQIKSEFPNEGMKAFICDVDMIL
ncbi:MAG: hypothetical protein JXR63_05915 [Spirochaetales bacterium]|nr:hypothetical protein [Spirochaetales bacterium]